jgi:hypothetical protein
VESGQFIIFLGEFKEKVTKNQHDDELQGKYEIKQRDDYLITKNESNK